MKFISIPSPLDVLRGAAELLKRGGAVHNYYHHGSCHCFLGAIWKVEQNMTGGNTGRYGIPYEYVIQACESLLPGWQHDLIPKATYLMDADDDDWRTKLPEGILVRAHEEGEINEIANIVMTRAIKLCEAAIEAEQAIADGRVADEAELIAHGPNLLGAGPVEEIREAVGLPA